MAKIAGQGEQKIAAKLQAFLEKATYAEFQGFLNRLRNSSEPPLLYFCEYLDYWSMGDFLGRAEPFASCFTWSSSEMDIQAYLFNPLNPQPIVDILDERKKKPEQFDEYRWFVEIFGQALLAWEGLLHGDSALLVCRLVVGGTLHDEEIVNNTSCNLF